MQALKKEEELHGKISFEDGAPQVEIVDESARDYQQTQSEATEESSSPQEEEILSERSGRLEDGTQEGFEEEEQGE